MRMWNIEPRLLCEKHLIQEHSDMHEIVFRFQLGLEVVGFVRDGSIDPTGVYVRHLNLEAEMTRRGATKFSPISFVQWRALSQWYGSQLIDVGQSLTELKNLCEACRANIKVWTHERMNLIQNLKGKK